MPTVQRRLSHLDAERQASNVRLRAEYRAGEMLAQTPKATGAAGIDKSVVEGNDRTPTLADMGITKDQSANWQALADNNITR